MDLFTYIMSKKNAGSGGSSSVDLTNYTTKTYVSDNYAKKNEIRAYIPFNSSWRTNGTIKQFCYDVDNDANVFEGMIFVGELKCSDFHNTGVPIANGEAIVDIMAQNGVGGGKTIHITLTSGTTYPYKWEYTYWGQGSHTHGWVGFYPIETGKIPKTAFTQDVQTAITKGASLEIENIKSTKDFLGQYHLLTKDNSWYCEKFEAQNESDFLSSFSDILEYISETIIYYTGADRPILYDTVSRTESFIYVTAILGGQEISGNVILYFNDDSELPQQFSAVIDLPNYPIEVIFQSLTDAETGDTQISPVDDIVMKNGTQYHPFTDFSKITFYWMTDIWDTITGQAPSNT